MSRLSPPTKLCSTTADAQVCTVQGLGLELGLELGLGLDFELSDA